MVTKISSLSVAQVVFISFAATILLGTLLLALPVSHAGGPHSVLDDLFTSTSAVCVTGLMTLDLGSEYTPFGMGVIMGLIQVGGIGYMSLFSLAMVLVGKRLSLRDKLDLREATDQPGIAGLVRFVKTVVTYMLVAELMGTVVLATQTVPEFGWRVGLAMAAFFSVCAPNNAGFSMFSDGLVRWQSNPVFLLALSGLIIFGGLGFNVCASLVDKARRRTTRTRWQALIRIVLSWTFALLVISTLIVFVLERNNPKTLGPMSLGDQWLNAFFMAVQPRTSGFNSIDPAAMHPGSLSAFVALMFIGTGPGGTGGGIKLTTVAILAGTTMAVLRGQEQVLVPRMKRRIGASLIHKAVSVTLLSLAVVGLGSWVLTVFEDQPAFSLIFEAVSAFATAGVSVGVSGKVGPVGKVVLILLMFSGRIGVLVLMNTFVRAQKKLSVIYSEENLLVG